MQEFWTWNFIRKWLLFWNQNWAITKQRWFAIVKNMAFFPAGGIVQWIPERSTKHFAPQMHLVTPPPLLISASSENFPASSLPFLHVLWSHCFGPCIISFLEPTVWSQSGLSASLGSANKLGSEGHTAGDLEACKPLTPFLLVFTIHTISGAGMPSQWGPLHCLVTKIL